MKWRCNYRGALALFMGWKKNFFLEQTCAIKEIITKMFPLKAKKKKRDIFLYIEPSRSINTQALFCQLGVRSAM